MKNKFSFIVKAGDPFPIEWNSAMYMWRKVKITVEKLPDVESVAKTVKRLKKVRRAAALNS